MQLGRLSLFTEHFLATYDVGALNDKLEQDFCMCV